MANQATATPVPEGGEEDFDLFGPGSQVPECLSSTTASTFCSDWNRDNCGT